MAKKKYELTPEHRAQMEPWARRWIANALSTKPMDETDRAEMRAAIRGLYASANLTPPPDARIVFVPSPFVARVAGGFAAAIWYLRKKSAATLTATRDATGDATRAATMAATRDATRAATGDATRAATLTATLTATWDATGDATRAATMAATRDATRAATRAATWDATWDATGDATVDATRAATRDATWDDSDHWYTGMGGISQMAQRCVPGAFRLAIACAYEVSSMWDGGNQWSGYPAWLSFFRHVVRLPLDYSRWQHYEAAARHGGHRVMHAEFCIVSDRPRILTVDAQSRPHHDTGPFCRWSDGTALYAWHGTRVPWWVIEQPERITVERIQQEENAEVRRAMIEKRGWDWYLDAIGATPVQTDRFGALYRTMMDEAEVGVVVVTNSTPEPDGSWKRYALLVPAEHQTAHAAVASTFGLTAEQYQPMQES